MDQYPQQPQPQQPPQPEPQPQPHYQQVQPAPIAPGRKKMSGRTKTALWLLIGPTAMVIGAFTIYAILNAIGSTMEPMPVTNGRDLFNEPNPLQSIGNIILFAASALAFLTWLPGLIIGIVLLTTKKK